MLAYVEKLTLRPGEMVEADVIALRTAGFSDAAILDINQVTGYYAFVNRLADGLGVELEDFWEALDNGDSSAEGSQDRKEETDANDTPSLVEFLRNHKQYGFKDKSAMVRAALLQLQAEVERRNLELSAELYAEVYEEDTDLQELTEAALAEWPE